MAPQQQHTLFQNEWVRKEWTPTTMTDKMRIHQTAEFYNVTGSYRDAIEEITVSSGVGNFSEAQWEKAAKWEGEPLSATVVRYLSMLGYKAATQRTWHVVPTQQNGAPTLILTVNEHKKEVEHTWYMVECKVTLGETEGSEVLAWTAPRRLCQLRSALHDVVKDDLGIETYAEHFGLTPFAKLGGPRGTTARLQAWFESLCRVINNGLAPPCVVAAALKFMICPCPSRKFSKAELPATTDVQGVVQAVNAPQYFSLEAEVPTDEESFHSNMKSLMGPRTKRSAGGPPLPPCLEDEVQSGIETPRDNLVPSSLGRPIVLRQPDEVSLGSSSQLPSRQPSVCGTEGPEWSTD